MENLIIIGVVVIVISLAGFYMHKAKKRGVRCIGCPSGCSCNGTCGGCCHSGKSEEPGSF